MRKLPAAEKRRRIQHKPTKEERTDVDECDRVSARLMREQKKWYEEQKKATSRRRR